VTLRMQFCVVYNFNFYYFSKFDLAVQTFFFSGHVTVLTCVNWPLQCCKLEISLSKSRNVSLTI